MATKETLSGIASSISTLSAHGLTSLTEDGVDVEITVMLHVKLPTKPQCLTCGCFQVQPLVTGSSNFTHPGRFTSPPLCHSSVL